MSPQSAMLDIRASSPETLSDCLSIDSPIPQYTPSLHHAVTIVDHSSSPESVFSDTEYEALPLLSFFENRPLSPDSSCSVNDYGSYSVSDLPLEKDITLETTHAEIVVEEACIEKSKSQERYSTFIMSKPEEIPIKHKEMKTSKIKSVVSDCSQSQQNTFTPKAEVEPLSGIETETSQELCDTGYSKNNPVTGMTKPGRKKKSKKSVKAHEPVQNVTKYQEESSESLVTYEEIQGSVRSRSPVLSPETASDDLASSLAFTTKVPEVQQLPGVSLVSEPQHDIPLSLAEDAVPVHSLTYEAELWKLISQIRDPQYVGDTYMNKIGVVQFAKTKTESYQSKLDAKVKALPSEYYQRRLSQDSEAEYRPMSPQSLLVLDTLRPDSSNSRISVASQEALMPDSPVPQYFVSLSGPSQVHHRSDSTESVLSDLDLETDVNISFLFENRPASPDSVTSVNMYRALSPESPVPDFRIGLRESVVIARLDRSSSLESTTSDLETVSPLLLTEDSRSSPCSVDENGPLSTESPIPVFGQALYEVVAQATLSRSSSPVSVCSNVEYGAMSLSQLSSECRPSSPDSVVSGFDCDSPIPEFTAGLTESESVITPRSPSPESLVSDVEYAQRSVDIDISEQRADSPESQVLDTTERPLDGSLQTLPLKAIRVPVYRLVYDADLWKLISQIHDPHYVGETFCSKTGVFEYAGTRIEYVPDNSAVTHGEIEGCMTLKTTDSSDADVQQAMQTKQESPALECSPLSPGSLITETGDSTIEEKWSAEDDSTLRSNQLISQLRDPHYIGDTLVSKVEAFEYENMKKETGKPMSPDPESEYTSPGPTLSSVSRCDLQEPGISVEEYRPDTKDNKDLSDSLELEVEEKPMSPDSESEFRPFSPASLMFISNIRSPSSESSGSLNEFTALSPDSPIPDFRQVLQESPNTFTHYRSSSLESVLWDFEEENESSFPMVTECRSSPDSFVSLSKYRRLSPDSPIPDFRQALLETHTELNAFSPFSPESVVNSEREFSPLIQRMFDFEERAESPQSGGSDADLRCLSPDSPVPQYTVGAPTMLGARYESTSPGSVFSDEDLETDLCIPWLFEDRAASPGSATSHYKRRPLSPDSPIPDFSQTLPEPSLSHMCSRSSSPDSVLSDFDEDIEISFPMAIEDRSSPESLASLSKYTRLSPDSPVPDFRKALPETYSEFNAYRSLSPESEAAETEHTPLIPQMFDLEQRAESPQSGVSDADLRFLSPDSPVPQYIMSGPTMLGVRYGSTSPGSVFSEEDLENDLCIPWLFEDRASSPGSAAPKEECRPLSSDSPIPDFTHALQETSISHMCSRCSSPDSVLSHFDEDIEISFPMAIEDRSSPESLASLSKYTRLSPDSPVPDFRKALPETYSECNAYRSLSPWSLYSDEDLETDLCIPWLFEDRASSPGSATSHYELRPLSPDSPIPDFSQTLPESISQMCSWSSSPESEFSDFDEDIEISFPMAIEDRSSPESLESLSKYRRLSPDSPVPDFRKALPETYSECNAYRSLSPESEAAETEHTPLIPQMFDLEQRAESPQSGVSDADLRFLSPDSPVPQYIMSGPTMLGVRYGSTSPGSVFSEEDLENDLCIPWLFEDRASSPGSAAPKEEFRPLSPDSPIPDFTHALQETSISHMCSRCSSPDSVLSHFDDDIEISFPMAIEDRSSPESLASLSKYTRLSPDSPVPDFRKALPETYSECNAYRSLSPWSLYSDEDLETDLCIPWLFEDRAASPGSATSHYELRPLSPDSPIPDFSQTLPEPSLSHMCSRSSSPDSVLSDFDEDIEISFPMAIEDRSSPESLASLSKYTRLSPDSPVPDFRKALPETYSECNAYRSLSPESEAAETEHTPLIPQMFDLEQRAESPQSGVSDADLRFLSPDSPVPQYIMSGPTMLGVRYGSTSPGSVFSEEDLENDLCIPWLFEDRASSPGSAAPKEEFRPLSPDSPIPDFTHALQETSISHMCSRCSSPDSVLSHFDEDIEISFPMAIEDRSSPESLASLSKYTRLSPDSPVPDFRKALPETYSECNAYRSLSPWSLYSDEDLETDLCIPWLFEDRASSPGPATSHYELRPLSPDSPIPDFSQTLPESISQMCSRSSSPHSVLSDLEIELTFQHFLESRPSSPESQESIRLSPDSPLPDFMQPMFGLHEHVCGHGSSSPESMCSEIEHICISLGSLVYDNRLSSPGSGASGDEYQALSSDSPLPEYRPAMCERVIVNVGYRSSSPESTESEIEYALSELLMPINYSVEDRPDSPESLGSEVQDDELKPLSSDSPIPDLKKTFENNMMTVRDISTTVFVGSDDLSHICTVVRSASPETFESDKGDPVLSTTMAPLSPENSATLTCDAELWKLISQVHDPQYVGKTFSRETGFMQCIGSTIENERSVPDGDQDNTLEGKNEHDVTVNASEGTHICTSPATAGFLCTSSAQVISEISLSQSDKRVSESPPPVIEHIWSSGAAPYRQTKYTFEKPSPEVHTESDDHWVVKSVSDSDDDDLRDSPESLIDYRPISPDSVMVMESRPSSPESVSSVNEFRRLLPDSPIPEFTTFLPEYVTFLRSASSSPETLASDIDYAQFENMEYQLEECRPSSPGYSLLEEEDERERPLSSQSLPEYRPMSLESAMQMDQRASSPESMPEFNENRSLSPDSPIPQFTVPLEYIITHRSSSPDSTGSDSECELMVSFSRDAETDRPSSRESMSSPNEFSRLIPDSPVPDFMRILSSYFIDATLVDRSSSPVSFSSDSEFVALPIDCWIDDGPRPLSPQTVDSEDELAFCCEDTEPLSHVTLPSQSLSLPNKGPSAELLSLLPISENKSKEENINPDSQKMTGPEVSSKEGIQRESEAESISTSGTAVCEEDFQKDFSVKPSPVQDPQREGKKIQLIHAGELKKTTGSQRAPPQILEEPQFLTDDKQSTPLSATTLTEDSREIGLVFDGDKPMKSIPRQLPEQNIHTTHRTVTPVLPASENISRVMSDRSQWPSGSEFSPDEEQSREIFSPMSTQLLVPPDFEAVFSGHQTLRVSELSQASLNDLSPVCSDSISAQVGTEATSEGESEYLQDFESSPDFNRVVSEFEKTASAFESGHPKVLPKELRKGSDSPQHSDSDGEFFDCKQALSDNSEPDEMKLKHEMTYHISEPPSPMPGSRSDLCFLKGSPEYTAHSFLGVEDYKRFSSGSESFGELNYDSEGSREYQTEGNLPVCEELPSRDQAGYDDDDDFLGREIAEELGMLSDSSEEDVLTTRVVRRRVIIQADNLPDIPAQTVTEEKYTDEHGNMVVKKITRKVIRKYVSADGMETQEVTIEGSHQETVHIEEGDTVSRVVKRTVLHSGGDQRELTFSEPLAMGAATSSEFEVEPVKGRKVSKVVKTTVVRGERMEKQTGDSSLAADLPSARKDFEKKRDA
ncbi:ankyrin-2b isoform X3 [Trematomus bernacchii]|uniref:ankyrin-2b isoform X3 n=1 Tax=Trematomus bernacchii TaxID=40690 RepID=UPI001469F968|nr:ankyrin-2b isoform X3 [Trematomus bernacchii]